MRRSLEWVVKISKLCNLRCEYCYEYDYLSSSARISLVNLERLFRNIKNFADQEGIFNHSFVWHGGEPTLISTETYRRIFELQELVFDDARFKISNSIQTNLVKLSRDWLTFLASGVFASVGVSFDMVGSLRVDTKGRCTDLRVAENIDRLRQAGVHFGVITVLSTSNIAHAERIFDFCAEIGRSFRLLPVYREALSRPSEVRASLSEVADALVRVWRRWSATDGSISVQPLTSVAYAVAKFVRTNERQYYSKRAENGVFFVDTTGDLYGEAEPYQPDFRYLNAFTDDLCSLDQSPGWTRALAAADMRIQSVCAHCVFFGVCDGRHMAEATQFEWDRSRVGTADACVVPRRLYEVIAASLVATNDAQARTA
ncbi:uncharacterized protein ABIE89_002135 [Bradyrhizobium niftali]|uniref:radical SAM protein n=1 Tax=Bradyrhizobium niftali TaxID=2560055 RepID=UPI003836E482